MLEQDAATLIRALGWKIAKGPYFNVRAHQRGVFIWSIKSVLSKEDLKKYGIKEDKNKPAGTERTVRFQGTVEDGVLVSVKHISTSERKRLVSRAYRKKGKKKHVEQQRDPVREVAVRTGGEQRVPEPEGDRRVDGPGDQGPG